MKRIRNYSISGSKYFILGVIFLVTVIITFISMKFEQIMPSATTMADATLPTVAMDTEAGTQYNVLHGYTSELDSTLFYGNITPVNKDRKLAITINTYGEDVESVGCKIRSLEDKSLIENTEVSGYQVTDNKINVTLNIKNLLDTGKEYALEVVLKTKKHDAVYYYTRIMYGTDYDLQKKLDFVRDFNACTFDSARLKDIGGYLETSSVGDNTNYGKVNINCSLSQIGWGDLEPYIESEITPEIISINDDVAIIRLDYRVGAANDYSSSDTYNVNEYYRIRQTNSGFYLLNFEREMNQVFDAKNDLTSSAKINLGINSSTYVNCTSDENGIYTYFVNQGSLWCFSSSSQTFTRVFSFRGEETDSVREDYDAHNIKIMKIEDNGDATFLVSGYMNRGEHEGQVGVSLCRYSYSDNDVTERLFIPVAIPYNILTQNVGGVSYVSNDKFYILIDETLYSVDLVSKEVMTEITGLKEDAYAVSDAGDAIAYSVSGDIYNTDTIRILNMSNDSAYEVNADEGDTLRPLGYIDSDFIYGMAHKDDIISGADGSRTYAMYRVGIIDVDYNLIKEYEQPDIYVSSTEVQGKRITLSRIVKSGSGYVSTSIDQLINKDENVIENAVKAETISTDARKQELYIDLITKVNDISVTYRTSGEIIFKDNTKLELEDDFSWNGRYYVYGYGKFQGSRTQLESAITLAYDTYGTVVDSNSKLVWKRYRSTQASIDGIVPVTSGDSIVNAVVAVSNYLGADFNAVSYMEQGHTAVETFDNISGVHGISLTGITYEKALSYVGDGSPVIARIGEDEYIIITAYNSSEIAYIEASTGAQKTVSMNEAGKMFSQGGNIYVTYYK